MLLPNQDLLISACGKIGDGMEIKIMLKKVRRISGSSSSTQVCGKYGRRKFPRQTAILWADSRVA
jgi:hypothetical protein